jgi:hypothetical protein
MNDWRQLWERGVMMNKVHVTGCLCFSALMSACATEDCEPALMLQLSADGRCAQSTAQYEVLDCEVMPRKATKVTCVKDSTGALFLVLSKEGNELQVPDALGEAAFSSKEGAVCSAAKQRFTAAGGLSCESSPDAGN